MTPKIKQNLVNPFSYGCFSNGRILFKEETETSIDYYEYSISDHLGNLAVTFKQKNDKLEVLQRHFYYPFGMNFDGVNPSTTSKENRYQYNGKELEKDYGIDLSDYGARWYDAAIGRWTTVDPLADKYPSISPYVYVVNNPLIYIDPTGMVVEPAGEDERRAYDAYRSKVDSEVLAYDSKTLSLRNRGKNRRAKRRDRKRNSNTYVQIQTELNDLEGATEVFRIRMGNNTSSSAGGGNFTYNPDTKEFDVNIGKGGDFTTMQKIAHELTHADQYLNGELGFKTNGNKVGVYLYDQADERAAFERQNSISNFNDVKISDVSGHVEKRYDYLPFSASGVGTLSKTELHRAKGMVKIGVWKIKFNK